MKEIQETSVVLPHKILLSHACSSVVLIVFYSLQSRHSQSRRSLIVLVRRPQCPSSSKRAAKSSCSVEELCHEFIKPPIPEMPWKIQTSSKFMPFFQVCGEGHATGEWAKAGNSQTPLGTQQIYVEDDDDSVFVMLRPLSSFTLAGASKKKSKVSAIDRTLQEYIVLMVDSVNQVASAIQNTATARASQEKKIFIELMTKLSIVPGFFEKEVDTIYNNLSKNPTMI
ncbi:hypothetical protein M5K25_010741 [Dendrobium thyrsiflorum]|uniref:Uncharacterized protein n=1 Tax=Dendrobium thyrsiflorum TaxID=117978 RepID=A0ABD0V7P2_DENTH